MSQLHYVRTEEGQFLPINVRPSGVKCFTCGDQCPPEKLSQHLATHVQPKYNQTQTVQNKPNKLNLAQVLENTQEDSDIGVQSILPDQIPRTDAIRKKAVLPIGKYQSLDHALTASDIAYNTEQNKDTKSYFEPDFNRPQQPNQPELNCFRKIKFHSQIAKVQKKSIRLYENKNQTSQIYDQGGSKSRIRNVQQSQKRQYGIKKLQFLQDTQASSDRMNHSTYNITTRRKEPIATTKISTFAIQQNTVENKRSDAKNYMTNSTVVPYSPYSPTRDKDKELYRDKELQSFYEHQTDGRHDGYRYDDKNEGYRRTFDVHRHDGHRRDGRHDVQRHDNHRFDKLTCYSCKGFYCQACKSSIPPIYRPVPDQNGKYHMHPDAEAMQFYRKNYYGKEENICKNCQGYKAQE